ncbi:hypothetical protein [Paraburkholderia tropica]|uniref:hypothetical protein n=1 Tax=Paraburkholderia tropica TaxID=92647 RepID=UPI00399D210F
MGAAHVALQGNELIANGRANFVYRADITSWVLVECTGAPIQVAPAAASQHAVQLGQVGHGQCRLSVSSTTTLVLKPYNGNNVIVNGVPLQLPAAGVTYTASGLTAGTGYYVYLGGTTAAPVLSLSTNAHSPASNGVETMTSNTALSLVGMVYYNSAGQFAATSNSQLCFNWFQRRRLPLATATVSTSTASGSYTATTAVVSTMGWADDYFEVAAFGAGYNSTATDGGAIQIFQNGTAGLGSTGYITSSTAGGSTAQSSLVARNTNTAPSELTLYTLTAYIVATGGGTANFAFSLHGSTGG